MTKYLAKIHMNTTTFFRKRNVILFVTGTILIVAVLVSASAIESTKVTGTMIGDNDNQNYIGYGPNITGSVTVGPTTTKIIESQVHISLANASNIAEKAVGANTHTAAVRIGVFYGFLVCRLCTLR
jgi:hypothetical protein